jgi:pimeloyl-ACP methyl ester carboxylesterase
MDLQNLLAHLGLSKPESVRCIAGSLGCSILWCYAELFTADVFSHQIWIDQAPMQDYAFDGSWGPAEGNRGMNCEAAIKELFVNLKNDPDSVYRGTVASCLGYRSHPLVGRDISNKTLEEDEEFFVTEAKRGVPEWYAELMKDHTSLDWRKTIVECYGGRKENKTKVLVVATNRSGCFPAKGPMDAVKFANEKTEGVEKRAEGVIVDWGGHWCYWEQPDEFDDLALRFLSR